jgi:signal transduction histidine kinase
MTKPRVLIVDDDEANRTLLLDRLETDGFEAFTASDGVEAIKKVNAKLPDIILLDIMMPKLDGYEVLRRLKKEEATRYIPIILLTARNELKDRVHGLDIGAEDYIVKPFSLAEVSVRVRSLLRMRAMQKRLREIEKMAALGEMVNGIAHEVRNPLATIGATARRIYNKGTDEICKGYASRIIVEVERLERMMWRIDEYKGIIVSELREGNINNVIDRVIEGIKDIFCDRDIRIIASLLEPPPLLKIDEKNIKLAIFNILQNSVEAIKDNGELVIETLPVESGHIEIKIKDNGCGMDEEFLRNIFHPFHTSKTRGAGLGLAITHKIIQDHGGNISVNSKKDEGTTFSIRLPISG